VLVERGVQVLESMLVFHLADVILPMAVEHSHPRDRNERPGDQETHRPRRDMFASGRESHIKGLFHRARFNTCHATRAFVRPDSVRFVDCDPRGAGVCAQFTIDASGGVSRNLQRAEPPRQPQESAVGAKKTTPEILDEDRENDKPQEYPEGHSTDLSKEEVHLDIGHLVVGTKDESNQRLDVHAVDRPGKEEKEQILEGTERIIEPTRESEISAKNLPAQHPKRFTERTDWTEPAAEGLLESDADTDNCQKNEEPGGMDFVDYPRLHPVAQTYEGANGQKSLYARGTRRVYGSSAGESPPHEQLELYSDPDAEQDKRTLNNRSLKL